MAQLPRPAAVDVAAVEEDCAAWEDALDVDDSDLRLSPRSSSRPLRPMTPAEPSRHSHGQRIPGPASAVQDAMCLRDSGVSPVLVRAGAQAADADFLLDPWLRALQFLGKDRAWERPGIKRIKADRELHRAPLVVGVVTSCKPNGLGDLFLMIKDPTDSIGATVHRKVVLEGNVGQDISVGCVILLHKVAVFRPSHAACYLSVTKGKVVKIVRKDCGPPFKQDISSGTIKSQLSGNFAEVSCDHQRTPDSSNSVSAHKSSSSTDAHPQRSLNIPNTCSQPIPGASAVIPGDRACTQAINNVKLTLPFADELMLPSSKKLKTNAVLPDCYDAMMNKSIDTKNKHGSENNMDIDVHDMAEPCLGGHSSTSKPDEHQQKLKTNAVLPDYYDAMMNTSIDTKNKHGLENNMDIDVHDMAEPCIGGHSSTSKPDEHQQKEFRAANTATAQPTKERSASDAAANNGLLLSHPKTVISVASLAGWGDLTDEQISELLFANY